MMQVGEFACDEDESAGENDSDETEIETTEEYFKNVVTLRKTPFNLPSTVKLIECENGTRVYLVGTAHFSDDSIRDVKFVMENTLPDITVVELCPNRGHLMLMDEQEVKRQIKDGNLVTFVKNLGPSNGVLQFLLLRFTKYIMDQIGMAPGGEFRAAFQMASQQRHCHIVLGDRPINVTMYRTLDALGFWKKVKLFFCLLGSLEPITKEDIEKMKNQDLLEQLMETIAGDYPELMRSILEERDLYLAKSIWEVCGFSPSVNQTESNTGAMSNDVSEEDEDTELRRRDKNPAVPFENESASSPLNEDKMEESKQEGNTQQTSSKSQILTPQCCPDWPTQAELPRVVVAVVGIGHVAGICRAWQDAASIRKADLMSYKPSSRSWTVFKWTSKLIFVSTLSYGTYWLVYGLYRTGFYCFEQMINAYFRLVAG